MKTFAEYVTDWWQDYVAEQDEATKKRLMEDLIGEEETINDYVPSDEECIEDWLINNMTAYDIYESYFSNCRNISREPNMPKSHEFVYDMLIQAAAWPDGDTVSLPSFAEEYVQDMAYHIDGYDAPEGFFKDLCTGGCASGMIGMLIYHSDCKEIYIKNIDDMEMYKEILEGEIGGSINNTGGNRHYTFVAWLCYEELAYTIARNLFPETF